MKLGEMAINQMQLGGGGGVGRNRWRGEGRVGKGGGEIVALFYDAVVVVA